MQDATAVAHVSNVQLDEAVSGLLTSADKSSGRQGKLGKQGKLQDGTYVETICDYAYDNGLSALTLRQLLDIITLPNQLGPANSAKLIKSLYPAAKVSPDIICIIVSALGQGQAKPPLSVQSLLLKWIITVQELLEDPKILSQLYSVLFNLIDISGIRTNLCLLLAMITRRNHVRPFRIQALKDISNSAGSEPALARLKRTFETYCSDAPFGRLAKARAPAFSPSDIVWRERVHMIQEAKGITARTDGESSSFRAVRIGLKKIRVSSDIAATKRPKDESSISLKAINGVNDLIDNLESIHISPQMVLALDDPLLQRYAELDSNDEVKTQTDEWLSSFFDQQLNNIEEKKLKDVLLKALSYTRYTKTLPDPVEVFFTRYLSTWNGAENRNTILSLLSYVAPRSLEDLQSSLFNNLENALLKNTASSTTALLDFYTLLLRHWTAQHLSPSPPDSLPGALTSLTKHTSLLLLALLTSYPATIHTLSSTLSHSEAVVHLFTTSPLLVTPPSPVTIYLQIFLQPSLPTLSRLCSILASQKTSLETTPSVSRPMVGKLNGYLMDICNLLFRSRAFNTTDPNAMGCLLPSSTLPVLESYLSALSPTYDLSTPFSLSYNPILAALSLAAFRDLEEASQPAEGIRHAGGPVNEKSLTALAEDGGLSLGWKDYRLRVMEWLAERGVEGVGELMGCTMKGLMR